MGFQNFDFLTSSSFFFDALVEDMQNSTGDARDFSSIYTSPVRVFGFAYYIFICIFDGIRMCFEFCLLIFKLGFFVLKFVVAAGKALTSIIFKMLEFAKLYDYFVNLGVYSTTFESALYSFDICNVL